VSAEWLVVSTTHQTQKASRGSRTHAVRFTRTVLSRLSFAGTVSPAGVEPAWPPRLQGGVPPPHSGDIEQAPGAGVEPTPAGSEPAVLPLDDPGKSSQGGT
jgi:hypothetical protein